MNRKATPLWPDWPSKASVTKLRTAGWREDSTGPMEIGWRLQTADFDVVSAYRFEGDRVLLTILLDNNLPAEIQIG